MSLGVIIKDPEGVVLAADSRLTLTALSGSRQISVSFDNARKVLNFQAPHRWVGVVTYGLGAIGLRSAYSFLPEVEASLPLERQSIEQYARLLAQFFMNQFQSVTPSLPPEPPMIFFIAGFNQDEPYGRVYMVSIPTDPIPKEVYTNSFGIATGGQAEITHRLLRGYDERLLSVIRGQLSLSEEQTAALRRAFDQFQLAAPIQILPLQDCVDLATFFIRTTIQTQNLTVGLRGVGGSIDVAVMTRGEGFKFLQEKKLRGEVL
jgi:hypothetical protein